MFEFLRRNGLTQTERDAFAILDARAEYAGRVSPDGAIGRRILAQRAERAERDARAAAVAQTATDALA